MSKTAIIFPGQGAQKVGMASDLYNEETRSTEILNQAQEALDFDLLETMFTDEEGKLGETENTQPALLTHSVALLDFGKLECLKIILLRPRRPRAPDTKS